MRHLTLLLLPFVFCMATCKKSDNTPSGFVYQRPTTIELDNDSTGLGAIIQRMQAGDSVVVACYGNSITFAGVDTPYPAALQMAWRSRYSNNNIVVSNQGYGGWTAEMANGGMDTLVLPLHPDLVTIIFGINDMAQGLSTTNYHNNLTDMVQRLKQQGITVLVMSPTPLAFNWNENLLNFCREAQIVANTENVAFLHMHRAMVQHFDGLTDEQIQTLMPDLIHYNQEGYLLIADRFMNWWVTLE